MKRSEAKRLFIEYYEKQRELNMRFTGEDFVVCAEQIIGMLPPYINLKQLFPNLIGENHWHTCWEPEEDEDATSKS